VVCFGGRSDVTGYDDHRALSVVQQGVRDRTVSQPDPVGRHDHEVGVSGKHGQDLSGREWQREGAGLGFGRASLASDMSRQAVKKVPDGGRGDAVQGRAVERRTQRAKRRPVNARQHQQRAVIAGRQQPEVGIERREQTAARPGGLPADSQPDGPVCLRQLAYLHPDHLGETQRANPRQTRNSSTVSII
jgi:hypothetical protein